ncbi:hypothetical protein EVAR_28701_1 [Eumeta japonica]|uniref:HTH psq-type domain-containing protein n=1 Tax=Eumeta variegata TaxID=151549 RepID=A0A4C1V5A4_EUMVA|nr:hypothetical protein EVAR_28701_1 [Eumeta japonica]
MNISSWVLDHFAKADTVESSNLEELVELTTNEELKLPIGFEAGHIKLEPTFDSEQCVVSITHVNSSSSVPSHLLQHLQQPSDGLEELTPLAPTATPVCVKPDPDEPAAQLETLESTRHTLSASLRQNMGRQALLNGTGAVEFAPLLPIKEEPIDDGDQQHFSGEDTNDSCGGGAESAKCTPKSWTQQDMENALDALRNHNMSLTKASARYGIPSTTLWQRAHRLGIDTPKKEGTAKSWSEADLRGALHALRAGAISANKASKAYGIPSSTLYKIARREGIRLAAPFNAAPTSWRPSDLERALHSIRCGLSSVQRASTQYGIPTGTLYGRCKREGIELSRSSPAPWSEDAMGEALEAVRVGHMSINQAAIHYNLPYSSLYGRFKRIKCQPQISQAIHQCPVQHEGMDADHHNLESYQQYAPHHLPHSFHQHDPHFQNMDPGTFDMAQVNSHLHVNQYHDAAQLEPCPGVKNLFILTEQMEVIICFTNRNFELQEIDWRAVKKTQKVDVKQMTHSYKELAKHTPGLKARDAAQGRDGVFQDNRHKLCITSSSAL